jgi:predicted RNase H-like HicB family nuclease
MKKEFVFQIEQDEDMLVAVCHEPEMATQGASLDELIAMIRDLIQCRFEESDERLRWATICSLVAI